VEEVSTIGQMPSYLQKTSKKVWAISKWYISKGLLDKFEKRYLIYNKMKKS
jgi:hypothetical protein